MEDNHDIILDYFIFDMDDIELYHLKKELEKNLKKDQIETIKNHMNDFIINFQKENFDNICFPYLKTCVLPYIESVFIKFENIQSNYYYIILLLGHRNLIQKHVKQFYFNIILKNNFGMTQNIISAITNEVRISNEYQNFIWMLAEWYTRIEIIIFYITVINHIFTNVSFVFNETDYCIDNNYRFSVKSFAKKHFLKLVSYICKNMGVNNINLDYKKMAFILVSSFTYGLSARTLFTGLRSSAIIVNIYII